MIIVIFFHAKTLGFLLSLTSSVLLLEEQIAQHVISQAIIVFLSLCIKSSGILPSLGSGWKLYFWEKFGQKQKCCDYLIFNSYDTVHSMLSDSNMKDPLFSRASFSENCQRGLSLWTWSKFKIEEKLLMLNALSNKVMYVQLTTGKSSSHPWLNWSLIPNQHLSKEEKNTWWKKWQPSWIFLHPGKRENTKPSTCK